MKGSSHTGSELKYCGFLFTIGGNGAEVWRQIVEATPALLLVLKQSIVVQRENTSCIQQVAEYKFSCKP